MGGRSKRKGNSFERDVAKDFSNVFELPFNRTLSSGAFVGGKNKHRKDSLSKSMINASLGDIVTPDNWELVIECKAYADLDFQGLLSDGATKVKGWLDEVLFDTDGADNHLLIFKINRKGIYIALPYIKEYVDRLIEETSAITLFPHWTTDDNRSMYCIIDYDVLTGAYTPFPNMQVVLKDYIKYLAKG